MKRAPLVLFAGSFLLVCAAALGRSAARPTTLRSLYGLDPPRALAPARTALVLVDFQKEFIDGGLALPLGARAARKAYALFDWARGRGLAVVHVRNVVTRKNSAIFAPGSRGAEPIAELSALPSEHVVVKTSGGAFTGTTLDAELRGRGVDTLVVAGFMTHLAVHLTAADASALGYHVLVASDATTTRALPRVNGGPALDASLVHDVALASLADRFADVLTTDAIRSLPLSER